MAKIIYDILGQLYGDSTTKEVSAFLSTILDGLVVALQQERIAAMVNITLGVSISLMLVYFYMDLSSKASMDMISTDTLVLESIKLVTGVGILCFLPTILTYMFQFANGLYMVMRDADFGFAFGTPGNLGAGFFFGKNKWPAYADVKSDFETVYKSGTLGTIQNLPTLIKLLVPYLLLYVAKLAAFLIAVGNAISLIMRTLFSPIAVVNCFEGGTKSEGIRYLKKFLATAITFAVIVAALRASEIIGDSILYNTLNDMGIKKLECTEESLSAATDINLLIYLCVVKIAAVGAMFGGSQLAASIVGSHDGH